jgi:hypothetical protein
MPRQRDVPSPAASVSWDQALSWRMHCHHLDPPDGGTAVEIVRRLCGVQAQVASAAALAVAVRQAEPDPEATAAALADRSLVRTWAMRGTLHLLPADVAGAYLSLLAAGRTWHKGSWQKTFLSLDQMAELTAAVTTALAPGEPLTREELVAAIAEHAGGEHFAEHVASGWSAVLKPLAWQGLLCQGPSSGNRVTFIRPDAWSPAWTGLPEPDAAAQVVVPAYLSVHGPATPETFDQWLTRGVSPKAALRRWFADLTDRGEITPVDIEGTTAYVTTSDVDSLAAAEPSPAVRLLPGFDQYVLGPGTSDPRVVPAAHRGDVSRAAGWIAPVVVVAGRVAGTWRADAGGRPEVEVFGDRKLPALARKLLTAETSRIAALTKRQAPA